MKILLILEATLGGTSRHILDLASGLLERGVEVHLVYSTLRADQGFLRGLLSLAKSGPRFVSKELPITREVTVSDISCYLSLKRYIREEGPFDVIHSHSTKAGFLARLLFDTQGARIIYTPHGLMTMNPRLAGFRRRAVSALEATLARRTATVVVVSENERRCAVETGIATTKLKVIPNGIRATPTPVQVNQREEIRGSMGFCCDTVCIGWVGRFADYKRPNLVIEAYETLKQKTTKPLRLVMIGWGPLESALRRQVAESKLESQVLFLGQAEALNYMPAFDVLAHTSEFEAFGYVFVEALSSGVPIVTTRVGGTDELISNGVTGYVCDPWHPNAFAEYLRLLVDDPHRRSAMSAAARERASQYNVGKMVDSVAQLYSQWGPRPKFNSAISANRKTQDYLSK